MAEVLRGFLQSTEENSGLIP